MTTTASDKLSIMSSNVVEPKGEMHETERIDSKNEAGHLELNSKVLANSDLMYDAVDGENREHEQGLWAAAKEHPWACMWAFIMCFTIVSLIPVHLPLPVSGVPDNGSVLMIARSWNRSTCS